MIGLLLDAFAFVACLLGIAVDGLTLLDTEGLVSILGGVGGGVGI